MKGLILSEKKAQDAIHQGLAAVVQAQKALAAVCDAAKRPKALDAYVCKLIVRGIGNNEACSISFAPFRSCTSIDVASCGHYFESLCDLPTDANGHADCPLCRTLITWTTVVNENIIDLTS